ncbi:MAG: transposase [Gammaproteobacteria bacterium]|nr:transposase [Gammaproteobacteria bacterium]
MGYGTDISDEEWVILAPFLEPKQKGRPRKHSLRRMVDAIRYMQRTGCQWRLLPKDFGKARYWPKCATTSPSNCATSGTPGFAARISCGPPPARLCKPSVNIRW